MKTITVVGCGALGSHFALFARNWEQRLRLVDCDRVEAKNCLAQFHAKGGLRKNKTLSLEQTLNFLFKITVEAFPHRLTADNSSQLLSNSALVADCTDNIETRTLISARCREDNIPCLHGALSADGSLARIVWDEHFTPDAESGDGATCEDGRHLPFFALAAAQMAVVAQRFLETGERRSLQICPTGVVRIV